MDRGMARGRFRGPEALIEALANASVDGTKKFIRNNYEREYLERWRAAIARPIQATRHYAARSQNRFSAPNR